MAFVNLAQAQDIQKGRCDHGTQVRAFPPGDQVLVSHLAIANPTGDPWQGPFTITQVLEPLSYEVRCHGGRRGKKHLHVNDLRQWVPRPGTPNPP